MSKSSYYITTPIYYVNDAPHIGHAYTSLACDVMARFMRLNGSEVKFLTGTDEHGQKVEKAAANAGVSPQEFTDKVSERFRELTKIMNFSNDDFIRTTEKRHIRSAQSLWNKIKDNGHIYLGKYAGWYAIRDEAFYAESELVDGKAPTGAPVEWVEESSYFFDLSKWQDKLLKFYEDNPDFIMPESRRNEVISFVKGGLTDLSVSRTSFKWGVPVPGDQEHIMYVWIEALANYISALAYATENVEEFDKFWPADVHMVGKDIIRFHAVYWPAFLMAADLEVPKRVFAHGWWTNEGQKISKSLGNVIDPVKLVEEYGLEQVRYFLLREVPFGNDGNFSKTALINRVNSELANNIGNLVQRSLSMINKNCEAKVPEYDGNYNELLDHAKTVFPAIKEAMSVQNFTEALEIIVCLAKEANSYIDEQAPWTLKKENPERMKVVLYKLAETVRYIAILLQPFVPNAASNILDQLAVPEDKRTFKFLNQEFALVPGTTLPTPYGVFPRLEVKD
jgi:methionyl-tRNA synthetase